MRLGRLIQTLPGQGVFIRSLAFSPDGRQLAVANFNAFATLWNLPTRRETNLETRQIGVSAVAFSPDGRRLATGGRDGTLKLWDLSRGDLPSDESFDEDS